MIYVGIHQTDRLGDGYMGSGVLIKRAQEKYGIEHFKKEYIKICESRDEMLEMEADIVNQEFITSKRTYNVNLGGAGNPKDPKKTDYYKSGEHRKNATRAQKKAVKKQAELKRLRVKKYDEDPTLCRMCNTPLPYDKRKNKFCNASCAASFNNTGRTQSQYQRDVARATMKNNRHKSKYCQVITKVCKFCQTEFCVGGRRKTRKTCSDSCAVQSTLTAQSWKTNF